MARTNRAFCMLATILDKSKHRVGGMYCSEKLDGYRGIWIPAARGINVNDLPFANIDKKKKLVHATGLFTRYGNVIHAPEAFLNSLPVDRCLDGEFWMGRQSFQKTLSVCKREPESRCDLDWQNVKYHVFDSPSYGSLFQDGKINDPNFKKQIVQADCLKALGVTAGEQLSFEFTHNMLKKMCVNIDGEDRINGQDNIILHKQELLPFRTENALIRLEEIFNQVTDEGGEGLILRHPAWSWTPERSGFMCKYKNQLDDEGKVVGYIAGKGKHQGRLGSLKLAYKDKYFDVGGFTDEERILTDEGTAWAESNPGALSTNRLSVRFPLGSIVTFTYRELTDRGIPKEARYLRKFER